MKTFLLALFCTLSVVFATAQDSTYKEYVGKYTFPEGGFITSAEVMLKDSVLSINSVQGSSDLKKINTDTFTLVNYNGTAYFKRDSSGKVAGVKVEVDDLLLEGIKDVGTAWLQRNRPVAVLNRNTK